MLRWYTMDLRAPILATPKNTLTPNSFDGSEMVFRYRLPDSILGNIEVQPNSFPGILEFAGIANATNETIAIPSGRYFFTQNKIATPSTIMQTIVHVLEETHKEALWKRIQTENSAYIRLLKEEDLIVVQVFFQLK